MIIQLIKFCVAVCCAVVLCVVIRNVFSCIPPYTDMYIYRCIHFPRTIASVPRNVFHLNVEYLKIIKWNFNLWRNRCKPYGNTDDADSVAREPVKKLLYFFVPYSGSQTLQADWNKPIKSQTTKKYATKFSHTREANAFLIELSQMDAQQLQRCCSFVCDERIF